MSQSTYPTVKTSQTDRPRWTTSDLDLLPDSDRRYEIIDGELLVTRAPHWRHQKACTRMSTALDRWSQTTGLGETVQAPSVLFSEADNVIPDVVWMSRDRLASSLDGVGHLLAAPELVVEVLSEGEQQQQRDKTLKRKLYSLQGVQEYWIVDWQHEQVMVYRRQDAQLVLWQTLLVGDRLTSPLLPDFELAIGQLFD